MLRNCIACVAAATMLAACITRQISTPSPSPSPENTAVSTWKSLPIFPGAIESQDQHIGYHYTTADADLLAVRHFYEDEMLAMGWDLLSIADVSSADIGKGWLLLFTKDQTIARVDIFTKEGLTHVILHFD